MPSLRVYRASDEFARDLVSRLARWLLIGLGLLLMLVAVPLVALPGHLGLPLMVVGPFFFSGLHYRFALFSVLLAVAAFVGAAFAFRLDLALSLRACGFLFATTLACAVASRHLERRLRRSFLESRLVAEFAQLDALTGTKNRRVLDDHLSRLWQQACNDGRDIAVLLFDVDHFKAYNDRYGHQAGDQALRKVAQTLQRFVYRPLDVIARYGGEEFAVVLYDIGREEARAIAEQMRGAVSDLGIEHSGSRSGSFPGRGLPKSEGSIRDGLPPAVVCGNSRRGRSAGSAR